MRLADISLNEDTGRVGHSVGHTSQHHLAAQHAGSLTVVLRSPAEERPGPPPLGHPPGPTHQHRHLARAHLPPPPAPGPTRSVDAHRVRGHHSHSRHSGGLTQPVTYPCSSPIHEINRLDSHRAIVPTSILGSSKEKPSHQQFRCRGRLLRHSITAKRQSFGSVTLWAWWYAVWKALV